MVTYQKELKRKLDEYRGKTLYLYGAGNLGTVAYKILDHYGLNVQGYLVSSGGGWSLNGLQVHELESVELADIPNLKVILTLNDAYHDQVEVLLHQKGVYDIDRSFSTSQIYFFSEIFREIFQENGVDMTGDILSLGNIKIPNPYLHMEMSPFWLECGDIILPPVFHDERFLCEGKYECGSVTLNPGETVFDCGANIGLFSSYAASKGCSVYAFEPLADQLGHTLKLCSEYNGGHITHVPYALSDYVGTTEFNVSHLTQGSSFLADVSSESKNKVIEKVVQVQVTTIDDFVNIHNISRVDFIKADIEGAERHMLRGAEGVLREFAPKLAICTYHYPDDPQILESIIRDANPEYQVVHRWKKLFAYV